MSENFILIIMYLNAFLIAGFYIRHYWKDNPWFNIFPILMSVLISITVSLTLCMKFLSFERFSFLNVVFYWFCHFCFSFTLNKPIMVLFDREMRAEIEENKREVEKSLSMEELPPLSTKTYAKDSESLRRKQEEVRENIRIAEKQIAEEMGNKV